MLMEMVVMEMVMVVMEMVVMKMAIRMIMVNTMFMAIVLFMVDIHQLLVVEMKINPKWVGMKDEKQNVTQAYSVFRCDVTAYQIKDMRLQHFCNHISIS